MVGIDPTGPATRAEGGRGGREGSGRGGWQERGERGGHSRRGAGRAQRRARLPSAYFFVPTAVAVEEETD